MDAALHSLPRLLPLGDRALLVRFSDMLSDNANRAAVSFGRRVADERPRGVIEVAPNLVSVLLRYDPEVVDFDRLAGEVRLMLSAPADDQAPGARVTVGVRFAGQDLGEVADLLGMKAEDFIAAHCRSPLRVLATGFAPGFVYIGFHPPELHIPRRVEVRRQVPPGTVLFAAGQTAITSTAIPTGWHVIGQTPFRNFDAGALPPTRLAAGDVVHFEALP